MWLDGPTLSVQDNLPISSSIRLITSAKSPLPFGNTPPGSRGQRTGHLWVPLPAYHNQSVIIRKLRRIQIHNTGKYKNIWTKSGWLPGPGIQLPWLASTGQHDQKCHIYTFWPGKWGGRKEEQETQNSFIHVHVMFSHVPCGAAFSAALGQRWQQGEKYALTNQFTSQFKPTFLIKLMDSGQNERQTRYVGQHKCIKIHHFPGISQLENIMEEKWHSPKLLKSWNN